MKIAWLLLCLVVVTGTHMAGRVENAWSRVADGSPTGLSLNEILADPPDAEDGDANGDGVRHTYGDEFVEIYNAGPDTVNLSGWRIADATEVRHTFPDTVDVFLLPEGFVTVFGGGEPTGFEGGVWVASSGRLSLNNSEDTVVLLAANGDTVDVHTYGSEGGRNESLIRVPDGTGEWTTPSEETWEWDYSPQQPNRGDTSAGRVSWGRVKEQYRKSG